MKIENFSAEYREDLYLGNYTPGIKPGSAKKTKGGYVNFRVILDDDESMKDFQKLAEKMQKLTEQ